MRFWTAHFHGDAEPVLIPESFSVGAFVFGPLWLALHRAWIPAGLAFAAAALIALLADPPLSLALEAALALMLGLHGHDLRRWTIERRGYFLGHVLSARSEDDALGRLLTQRPDLMGRFMTPVAG